MTDRPANERMIDTCYISEEAMHWMIGKENRWLVTACGVFRSAQLLIVGSERENAFASYAPHLL